MAGLYRRNKRFWICYHVNGEQIRQPLHTSNERVALARKRQIEYELAIGDLHVASQLPLHTILQGFCKHLETTEPCKSYRNDISRLRVFFGAICESLKPRPPGPKSRSGKSQAPVDAYTGHHVAAQYLEDITPEMISRFLSARADRDGWSAKTSNHMREALHRLFSYAAKHHGFRPRDRRYPNPAAAVDRRPEPAPQIRFLSLEGIAEQLRVVSPPVCDPRSRRDLHQRGAPAGRGTVADKGRGRLGQQRHPRQGQNYRRQALAAEDGPQPRRADQPEPVRNAAAIRAAGGVRVVLAVTDRQTVAPGQLLTAPETAERGCRLEMDLS